MSKSPDLAPIPSANRQIILLSCLALVLAASSLGDQFFWADEGWTLFLARTTLAWGFPRAFDDVYALCSNLPVGPAGAWVAQPWLPYYLTAGAIALFGHSVALLRLPFVLIGAACTPLLYLYTQQISRSHRLSFLASFFLAVNVPFLLLIRNVRYYALLPCFTLLLLLFYAQLRQRRRLSTIIYLGLTSALFMHTMEPVAAAVIAALFLHASLIERQPQNFKALAASQVLTLAIYLPWFIFAWPAKQAFFSSQTTSQLGAHATLASVTIALLLYLLHLVTYHFPTLLLIPAFIRSPRQSWGHDVPLLMLVIVAVCGAMSVVRGDNLWSGYVVACIPLLLLLAAQVIVRVAGGNHWWLVALSGIFISSNLLNLPPRLSGPSTAAASPTASVEEKRWQIFRKQLLLPNYAFLLADYYRELTTVYEGPVEGIVAYLRPRARPGETFFSTNDALTINFMTGLERQAEIPFNQPPSYIIPRGGSSWKNDLCQAHGLDANVYLPTYLREHAYEMVTLDYPDLYHENEPVLPFHHFVQPRAPRPVTIFRYVGK